MTANTTDIAIVGGGVVGGLAALMLAKARPDIAITLLDGSAPGQQDPRTLALAHTTLLSLQSVGIATDKLATAQAKIEHIHVSERRGAGSATLHAKRYQIDALGQVVSAHTLQQAIEQTAAGCSNLSWQMQTRLEQLTQQPAGVDLTLHTGDDTTTQLSAKFVIGADGGRSVVREQLKIARQQYDYQQTALIANVQLDREHQGWAYERFTEHGPIALLPIQAQQMALVWCVPSSDAASIQSLSDNDFLAQLQQAFGFRAGRFIGVEKRASYPLYLLLAERAIHHRCALIGNACHTLHPIAGQGYNLGVRDVVDLVAMVTSAWHSDQGGLQHRDLLAYEAQRQQDYQRIAGLTDSLVRIFSNQHFPLVAGRNLGLLALRKQPALGYPLARSAMGFRNLFGAA